ncbi:MAG: hypothetical protein GY737_30495 [Desulfobacteraceae bacterium]|nr:hypothetical protein [Desulfobacteraceae bacterium]
MQDYTQLPIIVNILCGIVGTAIFSGGSIIIYKIKTKLPFQSLITSFRQFLIPGGLFFYTEREYLQDTLGSKIKYISEASDELVYIGVCFGSLLKKDHYEVGEQLVRLANKGVKIQIYILSPNTNLLEFYAKRMNESDDCLRDKILKSKKRLVELQKSVIEINQKKFSIYYHERLITSTCFMIDRNDDKKGKILVDHSMIPEHEKSQSYGFEIRRPSLELFTGVKSMFKDVEATAININGDGHH